MHLYRPTYTRDGRTHEGRVWWIEYRLRGKRVRRSLETRDRRAAEIKAAKILHRVELSRAGIETFVESMDADLDSLVVEYEGMLRGRGRKAKYTGLVGYRLRRLLNGVEGLSRVTPEWIRCALDRVHEEGDLVARTRNRYRIALNGFFRWLVREERWGRNPVQAVEPAKEQEPDEHRRALTAEELDRLVLSAPPNRALVYKFAATSALRRTELRLLRWADLDLEAGTLTVRASTAKGGKTNVLPLAPSMLEPLRVLRQNAAPEERVFASIPAVRTLHRDLERIGVSPKTAEGKVDLHAFRVTTCTLLAREGVPLQVAQRIMRHSSPHLTANIYTKLELHDLRAAVTRIDARPKAKSKRIDPPSAAKA